MNGAANTMKDIAEKAVQQGIRLRAAPIACLADIKEEMEKLKRKEKLNNYQKWIVGSQYVLDTPSLDFEAQSFVIAVCELALANATFTYHGKKAHDIFEYPKVNMKEQITLLFHNSGYQLKYVHWLPQKRLAVRTGLAEYGRNNICYAEDFGSLLQIAAFVTDKPCGEYTWREVKNMDTCDSCGACVKSCPTGAILPNRFLLAKIQLIR
jgi:epoxyqueuosine reductase